MTRVLPQTNLIRVRWELLVWTPWGGGQEESGGLSIPDWSHLPYCCITEQSGAFLSPLLGERFRFQKSVEVTQPGFFEKRKALCLVLGKAPKSFENPALYLCFPVRPLRQSPADCPYLCESHSWALSILQTLQLQTWAPKPELFRTLNLGTMLMHLNLFSLKPYFVV